jgi:hypothetical protein
MVFAGALANAAPPAGTINPSRAYLFPNDDNYSGSGREIAAARRTVRPRLRFDPDNAALLRVVSDIPSFIAEAFPEIQCDRASIDLLYCLVRSMFERRPPTLQALTSEAGVPVDVAAEKVEAFASAGLVRLTGDPTAEVDARWILPTPELRQRGSCFVERVYEALIGIDLV